MLLVLGVDISILTDENKRGSEIFCAQGQGGGCKAGFPKEMETQPSRCPGAMFLPS